jgi:hypothetical protein
LVGGRRGRREGGRREGGEEEDVRRRGYGSGSIVEHRISKGEGSEKRIWEQRIRIEMRTEGEEGREKRRIWDQRIDR